MNGPDRMTAALTLPDGLRIVLWPETLSLLRCGVVAAQNIQIAPASRLLHAEIAACSERLRAEHAGRKPSEIEALQPARRFYRATGTDPTRVRPSSEALLRRVLKGQPLYAINSAVDACNLASLTFLLPIGLYDRQRITGDIAVRLGQAGHQYPGIRKGPVHLEGRLGLFDAAGPFGSPTSDSARTAVSHKTRQLLALIMASADYPEQAMAANVDLLADLMHRHCGGRILSKALVGWEQT
jgi:DNA/RNA-binding domain of Phe-tRNA-synthetase-like protein